MKDEIIWENWKEKNCPPYEKEPDENLLNIINNNNNINNNINNDINENVKEENKNNTPKLKIENSNMNAFNFDKEFKTNLKDLKNIKVNFKIDDLNSEVPFIGTYLNSVLDDADIENELSENEKIINRDSSFSWKFLRLLSQNDLCKLNVDGRNKVLLICENLYNQYLNLKFLMLKFYLRKLLVYLKDKNKLFQFLKIIKMKKIIKKKKKKMKKMKIKILTITIKKKKRKRKKIIK